MTTYNKIVLSCILLLSIGCATSCTSDSISGAPDVIGKTADVAATIGHAVETKASMREDDKISYLKFVNPDKIGFYAKGGLEATNKELTYSNGSFLSAAADPLLWNDKNATNLFAYYPYSLNTEEVDIWREAASDWKDGFEDLLTTESKSDVPNGTLVSLVFKHHFAMLLIKRGEGFDKATTGVDDIHVTLADLVDKTAVIKDRVVKLKKSVGGVKELEANKGEYKSKACWHVIVPIGEFTDGGKSQVESIRLKDDEGVEITVPFTRKDLVSNTKYIITIQKRNDKVVIEPEEIIRWTDEEVNIVTPPGIDNKEELQAWCALYNAGTEADYGSFGTKDVTSGKWTFRLTEDIDITNQNDISQIITSFSDIFDGQGHNITGLKLTNGNGFCGTLNNSGEIKNLKLVDIQVIGTGNSGAIAATSSGTITNCHVEGFSMVVGTEDVGGLVGNNTGAITNCSSSAIVSGTLNVGLLVGKGTPADASNSSSGVVVIKK